MVFSTNKNILYYLEKRTVLCAEVKPTTLNHRAWIEILYNYPPQDKESYKYTTEKYIFSWTEVPENVYEEVLNLIEKGFESHDFHEGKNFLTKYVANEEELEKIILQYLDDLTLLKPTWHFPSYPF